MQPYACTIRSDISSSMIHVVALAKSPWRPKLFHQHTHPAHKALERITAGVAWHDMACTGASYRRHQARRHCLSPTSSHGVSTQQYSSTYRTTPAIRTPTSTISLSLSRAPGQETRVVLGDRRSIHQSKRRHPARAPPAEYGQMEALQKGGGMKREAAANRGRRRSSLPFRC